MQNVLGPAVDAAGHASEAVLQRQRDADPVVRLQLRHGHHHVGLAQKSRDPELTEPHVAARERRPNDGRLVEVDEAEPRVVERLLEPGRNRDGLRVASMPGALRDDHARRSELPEGIRGRDDHTGVGVDRGAGQELHEVRLEDDAPTPNVRLDEAERVHQQALEVRLVALSAHDGDRGTLRLREDTPVERRRLVERAQRFGERNAAHARPRRNGAGADDELSARHGHGRHRRASTSASDPVASTAHATATGRSRNDRRRAIASRASRAAPVESRSPWRRNARSDCAVVNPPGSTGNDRRRNAQPRLGERAALALQPDERDRGGLGVAA